MQRCGKEVLMIIRQLYTNCLSEAAYFVASGAEAAIIDPIRDIDEYLDLAKQHQVTIKYIFETHFHADFISGHLDLSEKTGAPIVYGPNTETAFPIHLAKDGERFKIGDLTIEVIHTPGHTLESCCYLLRAADGHAHCVFTGDTLFVGDVGRPDLSSGNLSKEELAGHLFDSLQKLKALPDEVVVYPAHGPGSSCGKNIGSETVTTIGAQKQSNYAMKATDKGDFIQAVTEGLSDPPTYFKEDARINKEGYDALEEVLNKSNKALSVDAFKKEVSKGAWILDTRNAEAFTEGFVPGAMNIGLQGRFAEWAGQLLPFERPVVLVTAAGDEREAIIRLARIGFHNVAGYLKGGYEAWKKSGEPIDLIINVDTEELRLDLPFDRNLKVVDVRKPSEFAEGHIEGAYNIALDTIMDPASLAMIEDEHNLYVHCQSGYRSAIASSLIKRQGFHNIRNVPGGFKAISATKEIPIVKGAATAFDPEG